VYKFFAGILLLLMLYGIIGCKKESSALLIHGKWNLQTQKIAIYYDDSLYFSYTLTGSSNNVSYVTFNNDNTFIHTARLLTTGDYETDTVRGTYNFSGKSFSVSAQSFGFPFPPNTIEFPAMPVTSTQMTQINRIDETQLSLHTEMIDTTRTSSTSFYTTRVAEDYYFSK
jgi:hypothetical protein